MLCVGAGLFYFPQPPHPSLEEEEEDDGLDDPMLVPDPMLTMLDPMD